MLSLLRNFFPLTFADSEHKAVVGKFLLTENRTSGKYMGFKGV